MSIKDFREKLTDAIVAGNIPKVVLYIFTMAFEQGASDIHIEPGEKVVRIRFRIDGVLREIIEYPAMIHPAMISRIKIMAGLKIDEQRIPQDGHIQTTTATMKRIELRVSTLPTLNREKICMRLQDKTKSIPSLEELGLIGNNYNVILDTIHNPNGIVLVTGPTGSGKTTTLYSILNILNNSEVNIMTIEDPIEYAMPGLSQSQVHPAIGYTFASGLRSGLRQDPDIMMVGEIRDEETIEVAIRAALTGHMVLSTIHTNSAVATIMRLLDMGVQPFKIAASLRTIQAQRLVRKICDQCRETFLPAPEVAAEIRKQLSSLHESETFDHQSLQTIQLFRGKGCEECDGSGMKGRIAIFEVMKISRKIETLMLKNASASEIETAAKDQGMTTLLQDGYIKALQGITTIEEVYRVATTY